MGNIKDLFKILLVIQIISCALASHSHPDAETIDFGLDPSRDQSIIEAAIRRGMDGDAVAELLKTKQPVVKTVLLPSGASKTTTYKLDPDGSISSKTITQSRKSYTYNSDSIPDDLRNSPTGTVTRTFTDADGHKVTQTFSVEKPKPSTVLDTDDLTGDWFNKPFPRWPHEEPSTSFYRTPTRVLTGPNGERRTVPSLTSDPYFSEPNPSTNYHRTVTRTYTGPNGEKRVVQSTSSDPNDSDFGQPKKPTFPSINTDPFASDPYFSEPKASTIYHRTRTYTLPNGEKRVVQTTSSDPNDSDFPQPKKPTFPSINTDSWPGFDFKLSEPHSPFDADSEDTDDWKVVDGNSDVETITKKNIQSWTPKTWEWPEFPTFPTTTTTTTARPKVFIESEIPTRKPLPNLDDFLKSQYGPSTTTSKTHTSTVKTVSNPYTPVTTSTSKTPIHINLEDLPVTQVYHNGKPADEDIVKNLPPHLKPNNPDFFDSENVFKIENKHPIDEVEVFSPKKKTSTTTINKTYSGPEKPTIKDLDPHMQEILKNAGISPEDISNIDGDTITKTRTEPDGRIITTTYKVKSLPPVIQSVHREIDAVTKDAHKEIIPPITPHSINPYKPFDAPLTPESSKLSPISEFLAKLGLTKFDITSQNNRFTKTIIDDGGQVLTATFVLSSPMTKRSVSAAKEIKPIK